MSRHRAIIMIDPASWNPGIMERCEMLKAAIAAGGNGSQLKAVVSQLIWCCGPTGNAIDRADELLAAVKGVAGVRYDSLASLQKDLSAKKHGCIAKRVATLKGGRNYGAHRDVGLEKDVLDVLTKQRRRPRRRSWKKQRPRPQRSP